MECRTVGDGLICYAEGAEGAFTNFREERGVLYAELTIVKVEEPNPGLLHQSRLNLLSSPSKASVVRSLRDQQEGVSWTDVIEGMCYRAVEHYRSGEPLVKLSEVEPDARPRWLLHPYLEWGGHTLLFADGSSGKSVLALAMAYSLATGDCLLGRLDCEPMPVAYLDWETSAAVHAQRLRALSQARFNSDDVPIWYQRVYTSLEEAAPQIVKRLDKQGIGMVVIDSAGLACKGSLAEPESANGLFRAINTFRRPALVLHHIAKSELAAKDKGYGTVFWHNNPRNTWSILAAKDDKDPELLGLCLTHTKSNNGVYSRKHAFNVKFHNEGLDTKAERLIGITISRTQLERFERFKGTMTVKELIPIELRHGRMSPTELAEATGATVGTVQKTLSHLKREGVVINFPTDHTWGLLASDQ